MPDEKQRATRRIDLSLAQVSASALAAVVGAVLASELGVYGTIIGAAVVSVGATTGGAIFQHLFRRTGEQLREATDRSPGRAVNGLRQVPLTDTAPLPATWQAEPGGEWNDSGVFRARRRRGWKTYAALSALVFVLAMAPILVVELATGQTVHALTTGQDGGGTSVFPSGGGKRSEPSPAKPTGGAPAAPPSPSGTGGAGRATTSPSPTPSAPSSAAPSTSSSPSSTRGTGAVSPPASPSGPAGASGSGTPGAGAADPGTGPASAPAGEHTPTGAPASP
ncbi:hypothetical protein OG455_13100 [Kitasatospora sp. NBC_01287]|uniref:hypothetical protein n=1 Tax=Kitasatospora sp. NBC_01287 TaxID=2903573 RepID=UPI002250D545|nr:hypothetical protein [Kitasatospora sp. NBC_01287]MCX4746449.1 hypothetical protein [Kitasatospora sp. NBC_01287]